jgi:gliding motility-associated-like protein
MKPFCKAVLLIVTVLFACDAAKATHIVGGEITYKYLGDTVISSVLKKKYQVSLTIYQDCKEGDDGAIDNDNPAYLGVFDGAGTTVQIDTDVHYTFNESVPTNFNNSCVTNPPKTCILKKTFLKTYYLTPNASGYTITYQRCCRNASINNIANPGNTGVTYFCTIPPSSVAASNNSGVFKNYPPLIICLNNPIQYDHSATDADGDSLTYCFCNSQSCPPDHDKPLPVAPPYTSVNYLPPYSYTNPISGLPAITINQSTGMITGSPNRLGRYLVTVCCNEYRNGVLINTVKREFQFVVTDCSRAVIADIPELPDQPNTYALNCEDLKIHFVNKSKGGSSYRWDFGVTDASTDGSLDFEPTFVYPDTGTYSVKLLVNPGTTCPDSISRLVKVYPKFKAGFEYDGLFCPGSTINFTDVSSSTIKPITSWNWFFGDGGTSSDVHVQHSYTVGGTYNVMLVSANIRGCRDTALKQLIVQNFKPFAGQDTIIVKGEHVNFNAHGGINYTWSPSIRLDDTLVNNPRGYFPDTGRFAYNVYVESAYGCKGYDTIRVTVINDAHFFVPNAFTPNGDGLNDIFRPRAVGYSDLKFFRVYNRWGQEVYFSETLETGWNGTVKGVPGEIGTYYWVIRYVDRFGAEGMLKGDVTLLR